MRRLSLLGLMLFGGCLMGCTPMALPMEMGQAFKAIATSTTDQAVWQHVMASIDGNVIEPGLEGYAGILYVAGAKLTGAAGGLDISAQGEGSGVQSPDAQALIREILADRQAWDKFADSLREYLLTRPVEPIPEAVIEPAGGGPPPR